MNKCPYCNHEVSEGACWNRYCDYRGPGETKQQQSARLGQYVDERTSGGNAYGHYED